MEISGEKLIFLFGCLGGVAVEVLRWFKLRESDKLPVYAQKPGYWVITVVMILIGGVIAIAYGTGKTTAILAMNLGASAPAIIGSLATQPKNTNGAEARPFLGTATPTSRRLRSFLAFGS
jgi:hypothetical protein